MGASRSPGMNVSVTTRYEPAICYIIFMKTAQNSQMLNETLQRSRIKYERHFKFAILNYENRLLPVLFHWILIYTHFLKQMYPFFICHLSALENQEIKTTNWMFHELNNMEWPCKDIKMAFLFQFSLDYSPVDQKSVIKHLMVPIWMQCFPSNSPRRRRVFHYSKEGSNS